MSNIITDFTNTYCEATQLHYNELVKSDCKPFEAIPSVLEEITEFNFSYLYVHEDKEFTANNETHKKQIHFNTKINKWVYTKGEEDGSINNTINNRNSSNIIFELENESSNKKLQTSRLNNFKDYGFTADFEGEIFCERNNALFGIVINSLGYVFCAKWVNGNATQIGPDCYTKEDIGKYNLTPIKKEWYENPNNFSALIVTNSGMGAWVHYYENSKVYDARSNSYSIINSNWRLVTKEEKDKLFTGE